MTFRRLFDSLITRLLLLGLCLVVFGIVMRYYVLSDFLRADLTAVVEQQQLALATYVARDIDSRIVQRQKMLAHLAAELPPELLADRQRLGRWLQARYEEYKPLQPLFSAGLFVVDTGGRALADYPTRPGRAGSPYADRDYVRAGLAGSPFIGRPRTGRFEKEPIVPMAVPIADGKGGVRAVLVGVTALAARGFLDALLASRIGPTSGGFLLISPRDRLFVASSQADMVLTPTPAPGVNALHDRAMAGFRGSGVTVNAKGVEEVAAMVSVPSADWFVVARLPSGEAFATVGRLQQFLIKNAALALLVFAVLASTGLYFVLRPLFRAAACADAMTRREKPLQALPVVRDDEVGHLIGAFNRLLVMLNDRQAELTHLAHHDGLTGLPNRALLADRIGQVLARAQRKGTRIGLLFMDLDGFKEINDTLGHKAGDEALRQIAGRFTAIVRQDDTLARVGGDEFVLLLGDLADNAKEVVTKVAAKCIAAMTAPFSLSGTTCSIGVSVGIALGDGYNSLDAFLQTADRAMYQAKEAGRGRYVTWRI